MPRVMPFGKFRNRPLTDVPKRYLGWMKKTCDLDPDLRQAVEAVLAGREIPPTEAELREETERRIETLLDGSERSEEGYV